MPRFKIGDCVMVNPQATSEQLILSDWAHRDISSFKGFEFVIERVPFGSSKRYEARPTASRFHRGGPNRGYFFTEEILLFAQRARCWQ